MSFTVTIGNAAACEQYVEQIFHQRRGAPADITVRIVFGDLDGPQALVRCADSKGLDE